MGTKYRPVQTGKNQNTEVLERYIENICNLNNLPAEVCGTIQFAILETLGLLAGLSDSVSFNGFLTEAEIDGNIIKFIIKTVPEQTDATLKDELDVLLKRQQFENEFFIVKRLSDHFGFLDTANGVFLGFRNKGMRYERVMERIEILNRYWIKRSELKSV